MRIGQWELRSIRERILRDLYERPESDSSLKKRVDFAKSLFNKREK